MAPEAQSIEDLLQKTGAKSTDTKTPAEETTLEKFEEKMSEVRLKEKEVEAEKLAASLGVPYVNLKGFPISPESIVTIPEEQAKELKAVCFLNTGPEIRVASLKPTEEKVKEFVFQLGERFQANTGLYQISEESFRVAMEVYQKLPKIKAIIKGVKVTDEELAKYQAQIKNFKDVQQVLAGASISDLMTVIMAAALQLGTSDVHIEAEQERVLVRFRVDGVLQEIASLPHDFWKKIIARIKLISGLKINVTERPQDGRFTIFLKSGDTDVRVSTIPTNWGESVVMRLLKPSSISVEFGQLGFRPLVEAKLKKEIAKPHGMIVTTGPTGSGKTTTLYAILRSRNDSETKIITLEDPIEYKLQGINQSQIDHSKNYTFAGGLRSILRQDPDVVMVGEIRDLETAEVAINAALTGHLMISTLHTNDAAGAIPRFIAMGVKPFLLAPALNAIMGQRLTRRIHEDCKQEVQPSPEQLAFIKKVVSEIPATSGEQVKPEGEWKFYKGKGCDVCNNSGYKGRVGIYELLLMSEEIRAAMGESLSEYQVRQLAVQQGMVSMQQDGILKVLDGLTTVDEILRVAGEGV
ncbi:GspE/PulE family protein [Patescibacteria group bacterium]|nr:GspE/PulE family protein [Patescibacteria group bacterium]MBU1705281.1 GspE/PulE family protein [Patescibacteria group bacterium]